MQREPERRATGEVDQHDELAERRRRAPWRAKLTPAQVEEIDRSRRKAPTYRRREPTATTLGPTCAVLVRIAEAARANPRAMECMLDAAWHEATLRAADKLWADAVQNLRDDIVARGDPEGLEVFDEQFEALVHYVRPLRRAPWIPDSLTQAQHFVMLASSFADNATIAARMDRGEDVVRKHQERARAEGPGLWDQVAGSYTVAPHIAELDMICIAQVVLERAGYDLDAVAAEHENGYQDVMLGLALRHFLSL